MSRARFRPRDDRASAPAARVARADAVASGAAAPDAPFDRDGAPFDLDAANAALRGATPEALIAFAADRFGEGLVLATSFGIQSAVALHLVTRVVPDVPVLWVDTGYLPPETYRYADELSRRLGLNLHVYQSPVSPARMEALYGRLFEATDVESLSRYDRLRKVEPFQRGLRELGARAWISGVRADQTDFRRTLRRIDRHGTRVKLHPILGWSARDVYRYQVRHGLPPHPLFEQGYATVGDAHSSRPLAAGDASERETRFHGLKQECGIQLTPEADESLASSGL